MNTLNSNHIFIDPFKNYKKINHIYLPNTPLFNNIDLNKFIIKKNLNSLSSIYSFHNNKKLILKDSKELIKNSYLPIDFYHHKKCLKLILYSFDLNFIYSSGLFIINFLLYLSLLDK